jgi:hypothetical protein
MFIDVSSWELDTLAAKLEPEIHAKREEVLLHGDELLNSFQVTIPLASQWIYLTLRSYNVACISR